VTLGARLYAARRALVEPCPVPWPEWADMPQGDRQTWERMAWIAEFARRQTELAIDGGAR